VQVALHQRTGEALRVLHEELEILVQERTSDLAKSNKALLSEMVERKHAEANHQRLANIVESSNDAIIGESLNGTVTSWNQAAEKIFGYPTTEMVGRPVAILLPPNRKGEEASILGRIVNGEDIVHVETRRLRKDGVEIDVAATISQIRDSHGSIVGASNIARDITAQKNQQAKLEETQKLLLASSRQAGMAEFATGVLHNVGNVLNSVNVAAGCLSGSIGRSKSANITKVVALMREHEADLGNFLSNDAKGKQLLGYLEQLGGLMAGEKAEALAELRELQKNIEHIKSIIEVQQDAAKLTQSPEKLLLSDLVDETLKMNVGGLQRSGITVAKEFQDIPPIVVEKHKVLQIVVNLVRNAMQACEGPGISDKRLTIRLSQESGLVRIAVADTGSGISPENLSRIFTRGFTTKNDGHGFGLHGAALAAKEMGGSLTVQSDGPGRGATFTLQLPMKS
jgi:PAS domain S-box-containing protein